MDNQRFPPIVQPRRRGRPPLSQSERFKRMNCLKEKAAAVVATKQETNRNSSDKRAVSSDANEVNTVAVESSVPELNIKQVGVTNFVKNLFIK
jgi:hypothetical protein